MSIFRKHRTASLCGGLLLAATATAALAGSGVGGVFNLGQTNTVNARTQLQGTTTTQQLRVLNSSTATGSYAVVGQANGGIGVMGSSTGRMGVRAIATNSTGTNYGIYATTASQNGYAGFFQNTSTTTNAQPAAASAAWRRARHRRCSIPSTERPAASSPDRTASSASRRTRLAPG